MPPVPSLALLDAWVAVVVVVVVVVGSTVDGGGGVGGVVGLDARGAGVHRTCVAKKVNQTAVETQ